MFSKLHMGLLYCANFEKVGRTVHTVWGPNIYSSD